MRKGSTGGSSTLTGQKFDDLTRLKNYILKNSKYSTNTILTYKGTEKRKRVVKCIEEVLENNKVVGVLLEQYKLCKYLKIKHNIIIDPNDDTKISNVLLPDDCFLDLRNKVITIFEKKSQHGGGSVDEKLAACKFKKEEYEKWVKPLGWTVKYVFVLDKWFKENHYTKHKDLYNFVKANGCDYMFEDIDISYINL